MSPLVGPGTPAHPRISQVVVGTAETLLPADPLPGRRAVLVTAMILNGDAVYVNYADDAVPLTPLAGFELPPGQEHEFRADVDTVLVAVSGSGVQRVVCEER